MFTPVSNQQNLCPSIQTASTYPINMNFGLKSQQNQQQSNDPLIKINLRQLRQKNRQTQHTIKSIETKITFMKNKQEKTVKRVLNIKRKLTSLQNVRSQTKDLRSKLIQQRRKQSQEQQKRGQMNKLIKNHLKYNKQIVMTLMTHKITEDVKSFKQKNQKLQHLTSIQEQNLIQSNIQKANRVRIQHIQAHQRRKLYFLDKLNQFKQIKQDKLKEQIRQRQRQEQMINQLENKQKILLQRLSVSQKFRIKCQQQYQQSKIKYKSFYEASRGLTRGHRSCDQSRITQDNQQKADIFIS